MPRKISAHLLAQMDPTRLTSHLGFAFDEMRKGNALEAPVLLLDNVALIGELGTRSTGADCSAGCGGSEWFT